MRTNISENYISNRAWLRAMVGGQDLILCGVSALEFLQFFTGYVNELTIDVYARLKGQEDNINYHIVESFDEIEFIALGSVLCATFSQTVNDMLRDFENTDTQALTEALSRYYFSHKNSFIGLSIKPENSNRFEEIKEWAVEYYCEG